MPVSKDLLRRLRRALGGAIGGTIRALAVVVPRFPDGFSLQVAEGLAVLLHAVNGRGRRAAHQNLVAVFGDGLTPRARRRIVRGSYRTAVLNAWALLHLRPLPPSRFARWVRVPPEQEAWLRRAATEVGTGIMVSGHFGSWELLLASRTGLPYSPRFKYLAETTPVPELDAAIDRLRDRGGGSGALRRGGALALKAALEARDCVGILVDRNVRQEYGGVYVPFLGLPARTTPLPVVLARRFGVPLSVSLCVPDGPARWRLWVSPDLMEPPTDDEAADVRRILGKVNDTLSAAIRGHPEAWMWMIKRWKSRPTAEVGRYPAYSFHDPDR